MFAVTLKFLNIFEISRLQMLFQISVVDAGNGYLSNLRDINLARTVHDHSQIGLNLTPNLDLQFVAWADDVITRNLHPVDRRERAWSLHEQRLAEQWQWAANRVGHHLFEFGFRSGRKRRLPDLRWIERRPGSGCTGPG